MADPEGTNRLEELFARAIELSRDEQAAFLEQECAGDTNLRARLEALLEQDERGAQGVLARQMFVDEPAQVERIGHYKLLEKLGEGGMGTVYLAEQEQPVRRKVALKTIRLGAGSESVQARFADERQALALMNHPGIAEIYDGGVADSGLPYFVMEYCPGLPITAHCDRYKLSIEQRLNLFRQVCDAVQHAHQKGIVHRDLKPGNILVTERDGLNVPKIIDFGIARAVAGSLREEQRELTGARVIGSDLYMSPEQADPSGVDVDTRTDIYALGVILYELLAGSTPFQHDQLEEFGFAVLRDVDPPTPSKRVLQGGESERIAALRRTTARNLLRALEGDLDWITMRCLEKDRARRYASASEVAADLVRHAETEPVVAGPPTTAYRTRKFIRRHRIGVTGATALVLSLVTGIVMTSLAHSSTKQAKLLATRGFEEARYESAKSNAVLEFFWYSLVHSHEMMRGRDEGLEMFLGSQAEIQRLFSGRPGAEAAVRTSLGRAYLFLGKDRAALDQLQHAASIQANDKDVRDVDRFATLAALLQATRRVEGLEAAQTFAHQALVLARDILAEHDPELAQPVSELIELANGGAVDTTQALEQLDELEQAFPKTLRFGDEAIVLARLVLEVGGALRLRGSELSTEFFDVLYTQAGELLEPEEITFQHFLWILTMTELLPPEPEFEKALGYARQLGELTTQYLPPEYWLCLEAKHLEGVALFGIGDFEAAAASLRSALDALPAVDDENDRQRETDMAASAWYVRCLLELGRPQEARAAFAELQARRRNPLTPETQALIAAARAELGE